MNIAEDASPKIPTKSLPKDWRDQGAARFGLSPNTVEKIVYGIRKNPEVFEFMLGLAEAEKARLEAEASEIQERIDALTK